MVSSKRRSSTRGNVLEAVLAEVGELERNFTTNLLVSGRRDEDTTRLRDALKPCRDIDAIAQNVVAFYRTGLRPPEADGLDQFMER